MPSIRQTNFLGGELDPLLWGRTDLPVYGRGLRRMRNFFASRHGAAVSRPGTTYVGKTKTQSSAPNVRLVPFVYSDDVSYVLEIGVDAGILYVRFFTGGAPVTATYVDYDNFVDQFGLSGNEFQIGEQIQGVTSNTIATVLGEQQLGKLQITIDSGPGFLDNEVIFALGYGGTVTADAASTNYTAAYELISGATVADLQKLKWAQVGDVLLLAHPGVRQQRLRRLSNAHWEMGATPLASRAPSFGVEFLGDRYPVRKISIENIVDETHPIREWVWMASLTVRDLETGKTFETLAVEVNEQWSGVGAPVALLNNLVCLYFDRPVTLLTTPHYATFVRYEFATSPFTIGATVTGATSTSTGIIVSDDGSMLRLSGVDGNFTNGEGLTDDNGTPGAATVVRVADDSYEVLETNYFRGSGAEFGFVGSTFTDTFVDLGLEPLYTHPPLFGTNPFQNTAYVGTAPPDQYPAAVAFFQERLAYACAPLQPNAVWLSATGDYFDFDLPLVTHHAGESLLYELAARRREEARHLFPDAKLLILTGSSVWSMNGDQGNALDFDHVDVRLEDNVGASHLPPLAVDGTILFGRTKGFGVRTLRFNGQIYEAADASAHSQHLMLGESSVSGDTYNKTIVDWAYAEDPWGVVWAARDDGVMLSMTHVGETFAWARHDTADGRVLRVCSVPEGGEDAVYLLVQRTVGAFLFNMIERMTSRVRYGNNNDDGCVDCCVKFVGEPALTPRDEYDAPMLAHLEGEEVWVVGVGNAPVGPLTVVDGDITLPELPTPNSGPGGVGGDEVTLYIGLPFTPELETLDVVTADSRMKHKTVTRVGFEVEASAGIVGGQDFEHLTDTRPNTVASGYNPPVAGTQLLIVNPTRKWDDAGRAVLRQSKPLPVTVVGLVREIDVGG